MTTNVPDHVEKKSVVGVEFLPELPKHAIPKPVLLPRSPCYIAIDLDGDFKIDDETLNEEENKEKLESLGGPNGLVNDESADGIERRFVSNTYTRPPSKSLIYFVVEAFKDLTILIRLGCATLSLVFGIKEHGLKEGWYDGGSQFAAAFLVVAVCAVSKFSENRQMMSHNISRDTDEQTPLQARLNKLTSTTSKFVLLVAFLVLFVRCFTGSTKDESRGKKMVAATVTIIVVVISEGSPLALTLTWAYSMKRMMKDQAMLRKLYACETMGSATVICTGTLTLNQMKVTDFWFGIESGKASSSSSSQKVVGLFHQGIAINTRGGVFKANSGSEYEFSGSPTEKAILSWAVEELKMDMEEVIGGHDVVHVEAFNSEKKRSGVLMKKKGETREKNKNVVHWKGAAEKILAMCSTFCWALVMLNHKYKWALDVVVN